MPGRPWSCPVNRTGYDLSGEGEDSREISQDTEQEEETEEEAEDEQEESPELEEARVLPDQVILPEEMAEGVRPAETVETGESGSGTRGGDTHGGAEDNTTGVIVEKPEAPEEPEDEKESPKVPGEIQPPKEEEEIPTPDSGKVSVVINGNSMEFDSEDEALIWVTENGGTKGDGEDIQYFEGFVKDENGNLVPSYADKDKFEGNAGSGAVWDYTGDTGTFVVPEGTKVLELAWISGNPKIKTIVIPPSVTKIVSSDGSSFTALEKFVVSEKNTAYFSLDGVLYRRLEEGRTKLCMVPAAKQKIEAWPKDLTIIGEHSFGNVRMEHVEFPDTVRVLADFTFMDSSVDMVLLPEGTAELGSAVFGYKDTASLHKVVVKAQEPPDTAQGTFRYMSGKEPVTAEILVPDSEGDRIYEAYLLTWGAALAEQYGGNAGLQILKTEGGAQEHYEAYEKYGKHGYKRVGEKMPFYLADAMGTYRLDDNGDLVLIRCTSAASYVDLSDSQVVSVEEGAFDGCVAMTVIRLPESLKRMPENVFAENRELKVILSDASVPPAERTGAPEDCAVCVKPDALMEYERVWDGQVRRILGTSEAYTATSDGMVMDAEGTGLLDIPADMERLSLPYTVTSIGPEAAAGNGVLTRVSIPSRVQEIGAGAFQDCTGLEEVTWSTSAPVPDSCFAGCTSLKTFGVPASTTNAGHSLKEIGRRAFYGCESLETVLYYSFTVDNGNYYYYGLLERIGEEAFYGCSSMEYAYVHSTVKEVGARAFREAGVTKADWYTAAPVPDGCFESCGELTAFNVNGGGHRIASIGDRAFYECGQVATVLWYSYRGSDGKNYLYYPYLERIGDEAFYGCAAATYAYLHTSVEQVGAGAFQGSGLTQTAWYTSARMPDSCFRDCVSLGTVGWGKSQITEMGERAFWGDAGLPALAIPATVSGMGTEMFGGREGSPLTLTFLPAQPPAWDGIKELEGLRIYVPDSDKDMVYQSYLAAWGTWLGAHPEEILKTEGGAESRELPEEEKTPGLPEPGGEADEAEANEAEPSGADEGETDETEPSGEDEGETDEAEPSEADEAEPSGADEGETDETEPSEAGGEETDSPEGVDDETEPSGADEEETDKAEPSGVDEEETDEAEPSGVDGEETDPPGGGDDEAEPSGANEEEADLSEPGEDLTEK
ncbi:MAG: leucine-rich repeat protein [Lachnospiraceae bacterium]|nr:leucine-rich repeat protein [Lachnospiraceae bacterium]